MQRLRFRLAVLAFTALLTSGDSATPSRGAEGPTEATIGPLAGTVADAQGRPAAGAKVWLYSFSWQGEYRCPTIAETVADDQGKFHFPDTKGDSEGQPQVLCLLARDADGCLAPAPYLSQPRDAATLTDLRLTLQEVGVFRGRIVDQAGQAIAGASVRAAMVNLRGEIAKTVHQLFIPDVLADQTQATTADDGSFSLRGMPSEGGIDLRITAPGYVPGNYIRDTQRDSTVDAAREVSGPTEWRTIEVISSARIEGIVVDGAGKPVADARSPRCRWESRDEPVC